MKELKDYLHLYLGCQCETPEGLLKLNAVYEDSLPVFYDSIDDFEYKDIKPILRSLFDMTNEEQAFFGCDDEYFDYMKKMEHQIIHLHTDEFHYLISKHFDLFGLIESGLAIDAKTLQPTTIK